MVGVDEEAELGTRDGGNQRIPSQATPQPSAGRTGLVGYAPGVFDMFHVGHLNLLQRARMNCDHLIAGVVSDAVALVRKGRLPVIPEAERLAIVAAMRTVDEVFAESNLDKLVTWSTLRFHVIFKGDDWRGTDKGRRLEEAFAAIGVQVVYLPYTEHTSTTRLRRVAIPTQ